MRAKELDYPLLKGTFFKVKNLLLYLIPGVFLWYFVHHSGIHATIAGVLLAFTIPTNDTAELSPLEKLEHALTQPVALIIMPVFALANTNITFVNGMVEGLASPLGLGIILGLFLGKTKSKKDIDLSRLPSEIANSFM